MDGSSGAEEGSKAGGGERRKKLARSLNYPCVSRLRFRRLLAFLLRMGYADAYGVINRTTKLVFSVKHLVYLVEAGEWMEAIFYVRRFAPAGRSGVHQAGTLVWFLDQLKILDTFAHSHRMASSAWFARNVLAHKPALSKLYPLYVTLADHFVSDRPDQARDLLDWQGVRSKAADFAQKIASRAPEIRGKLRLPRGRANSNDILPIVASSFRRRRHVKPAGRATPSDLAHFYLKKKKSLPSLTDYPEPSHISRARLFSLLEESLQAGGNLQICNEYFSKQGIGSVPAVQTMLTNSSNKDNPANIHPLRNQGQQYENSPYDEGVGSIPVLQPILTRSSIEGTRRDFNPFLNQGACPAPVFLDTGCSRGTTTMSAVVSPETDSDMKSSNLQETHQDTVPRKRIILATNN